MIRVNLLNSVVSGSKSTSGNLFGASASGRDAGARVNQTKSVLNLGLILLFPVALYFWSNDLTSTKKTMLVQSKTKLDQLKQANAKQPDHIKELEKYEAEKKMLEAKVLIMEALSKDRLRNVKVLDEIQKAIPEKTWVKFIEIKEDRMNLEGYAISDGDVSFFADSIQKNALFKKVSINTFSEKNEFGVLIKYVLAIDLESEK